MPEVDGLEATTALQAISVFKDMSHLPVIRITACPEALSVDKAFRPGCDAYLRKPVDLADLGAALNQFLRRA